MKEWLEFESYLAKVERYVIPRWVNTRKEDKIELHVFAEASQAAYAAAVYLKSVDNNGHVCVNLVSAKTIVFSISKGVAIPRQELCAVLLATKLIYEISHIMKIPKENLYAWSDSTVVLSWINGEPSRWTTFVSNRVSEILTMIDKDKWGHVITNDNPADGASRSMSVNRILGNNLW
ncbi:unnamed protein product [Parnassius mnemosyne]|uniref:RNase H type-1 domain-containing protein n=1 Tax=Parnassius mnemosyne TaxID=213953 RepID=A0AAV1LKE3_9NEOP